MGAPRFRRRRSERASTLAAAIVFATGSSCSRKPPPDAAPAVAEAVPEAEAPPPPSAPPEAPLAEQTCETMTPPPSPRHELATCDPARTIEKLTILSTADMHGHFHPYLSNGRSPFAVLRAFVERRRAETGNRTLFFDAGDAIEKGALAEVRSAGQATVRLLDQLGLDARTLGNHDFAWGEESVLKQIASPAHAVLASNVNGLEAKRTLVFDVGCVRVGVFGLVTSPYDETDERVDAPYFGSITAEHDPGEPDRYVAVATTLVRELRDVHKADVVIGLDHVGLARDRAIVDAVSGVDLVVSGHDHQALAGYVQGRFGAIVSSGGFLGGRGDARVAETSIEVDLRTRAVRLVAAGLHRLDDLNDLDASVQSEVARWQSCFAPDADVPIADLDGPLGPNTPESVTQVIDGAVRARFPGASAWLYESFSYSGIVRGELARGPVTPQMLADAAFSEKQRPGGPGFTAFLPIELGGVALRELCTAPLREVSGQRMHRVCPPEIDDGKRYVLVIQRRSLYAPHLALVAPPKSFPSPPLSGDAAVEVLDLLIDYARARGKTCRALDRDVVTTCR